MKVLSGTWNTVSFYDEAKSEAYSRCSIKGTHVTGHKTRPTLEALRGHTDCQKQPSCLSWGPLPASALTCTAADRFSHGDENSATAQAHLLPLGPTACSGAVSPEPARGRSRPYNLPRPALLSVSALTAEEKQPPSP